ncbi:hypothetical protein [Streptomyces sp. NPDC088789]|uniref:hypothetical protein n=1 Tax=Streptomyces sp. NPDC088789 TaxID=3365899 RepID=UPI00381FD322
MTFSYGDHRTLTAQDIAALEQRIAAYNGQDGHPRRKKNPPGEWVMTGCMTLTDGGQRLETEGAFMRWGSTQATPGEGTHTEFVLMSFTAQGEALPGAGTVPRAASEPPRPATAPHRPHHRRDGDALPPPPAPQTRQQGSVPTQVPPPVRDS